MAAPNQQRDRGRFPIPGWLLAVGAPIVYVLLGGDDASFADAMAGIAQLFGG